MVWAVAVRDGDVTGAVPVPGTASLVVPALLLLGLHAARGRPRVSRLTVRTTT
jgi:hypothetical protein